MPQQRLVPLANLTGLAGLRRLNPLIRLPSLCEVCRRWSTGRLCDTCLTRFAAPEPRCARCALRLGAPAAACGECLRDPPLFVRCVCVADYAFPWDRLIGAFKFHGQAELAGALAGALLHALQAADAAEDPGQPHAELVLPVPLAPVRLAARGYNQSWELARRVAAGRGLPADADLLQRPLDTAPQAELGRAERQRNLRAAFMVDPRRRARLQGRRVALVDDVMTTGATAREAAAALLRSGAAAVEVWVVARTPTP